MCIEQGFCVGVKYKVQRGTIYIDVCGSRKVGLAEKRVFAEFSYFGTWFAQRADYFS
jgi:hypothetical protein